MGQGSGFISSEAGSLPWRPQAECKLGLFRPQASLFPAPSFFLGLSRIETWPGEAHLAHLPWIHRGWLMGDTGEVTCTGTEPPVKRLTAALGRISFSSVHSLEMLWVPSKVCCLDTREKDRCLLGHAWTARPLPVMCQCPPPRVSLGLLGGTCLLPPSYFRGCVSPVWVPFRGLGISL